MKQVLFIASLDELYYFEKFIEACHGRDIAIFVFDPARYPNEAAVSLLLDQAGRISGEIEAVTFTNGSPLNARLSIQDIGVAWHIREGAQTKSDDNSIEARFAANESRAALHSIFSALDCVWINRADTIHFLSSNKLYQQKVAHQCGLTVPRTYIGNDPALVAKSFKSDGQLLLKSIGYTRLDDEGKYHLYSQQYSHDELVGAPDAIQRCPIFCQEYIPKRYEHRVMAIGRRILSCQIDSQASASTSVDWRHYDFENVAHVQVELPRSIEEKLLRFMRTIGLRYGAIDLIETPEGDYVFLEVNPSGQWGWIADLAGLPIPAAVAEMLADA